MKSYYIQHLKSPKEGDIWRAKLIEKKKFLWREYESEILLCRIKYFHGGKDKITDFKTEDDAIAVINEYAEKERIEGLDNSLKEISCIKYLEIGDE